MYRHDLEVMSSNPSRVELEVRSTSVPSRTWSKKFYFHVQVLYFDIVIITTVRSDLKRYCVLLNRGIL